jgi:hypothetical protein
LTERPGWGAKAKSADQALAFYAATRPADKRPAGEPWYWAYANVPPGHPGDMRPGYWQGNNVGPRSFGTGPLAFIIYDIPANNPLRWAHVYLPRRAFDEVRQAGDWVFIRKGNGYAALWLPGGYTASTSGYWKDVELKLNRARAAVLAFVGNAQRYGAFEKFVSGAGSLKPRWDEAARLLSAVPPQGGSGLPSLMPKARRKAAGKSTPAALASRPRGARCRSAPSRSVFARPAATTTSI